MAGPEQSRRPRLTLQTKPTHHGSGVRRGNSFGNGDIKSPTSLNTLSNIYTTAIERSTPTHSTPLTAIKLHQPLRLRTDPGTLRSHQQKIQTPFTSRPATPSSDHPTSPAQETEIVYPNTMTPTPPLSAETVDSERRIFTFPSMEIGRQVVPPSPAPTRRRISFAGIGPITGAPYSHNVSLHSILRNSPLPPSSAKSPSSQRRQSIRLQEKAARRVGYGSPLTQTITTERYIKSHIDLLVEEASPYTASPVPEDSDMVLDLAMAYSGNETKDGGQTPGPFEEMRRRMTNLATETPVRSPRPDGIQRRKRKEKKRKWVWTIGKEGDESEGGAIAALRAGEDASLLKAANATNPEPVRTDRTDTPEPLTAIKTSAEWTESGSELATETDIDCMDVDI
ncbi:hypothetical protein E0Z10_g1687 [Xylaria hypoxylon]|uniref:Uncharacterized protein n=1 Tax=Xylaria hypoxylon TaxID=37992 RepID=A0A4Z0YSM8_9PEZI|nr:hypothetical protein E0Z10_g1687 [Xylaria hypoxylon]